MSHKSMWLGGLVTALAFLIVAPAAFGYSKPSIKVDDGSVANIQQQVASQKAHLDQSGTAQSGDASANGGAATGGGGWLGRVARQLVQLQEHNRRLHDRRVLDVILGRKRSDHVGQLRELIGRRREHRRSGWYPPSPTRTRVPQLAATSRAATTRAAV